MKPSSFAGDGVAQKTVATSKINIGVRIHAFLMELELSCPKKAISVLLKF